MPSTDKDSFFNSIPTDNSSSTLLRYSLIARHVTRAVDEAQREANRKPFQDSMTVIGLVLSLVFNLIWLVGLLVVKFFGWVGNKKRFLMNLFF
jgi:hypothetical protein